MTTKEKLEQAIKSMEVARKEWNETKSDAAAIALKKCEVEVDALRKQVNAEEADTLAHAAVQQPEPPKEPEPPQAPEPANEPVDENKFIAPENPEELKEAITGHVLKVHGREALSNMCDSEIAAIYLELLEDARGQYGAKNSEAGVAKVQECIDTINKELEEKEEEQEQQQEQTDGDNTDANEANSPEQPENSPAEPAKEPEPTPQPEKPKKGSKGKKK